MAEAYYSLSVEKISFNQILWLDDILHPLYPIDYYDNWTVDELLGDGAAEQLG